MQENKNTITYYEHPCSHDLHEKFFKNGAESLHDTELVSLLLFYNRIDNAPDIINAVLRLIEINRGHINQEMLLNIAGIEQHQMINMSVASELFTRFSMRRAQRIHTPEDILPYIRHYAERQQEYFLAISLNASTEIINCHVTSIGSINRAIVHPREVFAPLLSDRAVRCIVAHNHPSGNCTPSEDDKIITSNLYECSQILGIHFMDHIIFSFNDYYSFAEKSNILTPIMV